MKRRVVDGRPEYLCGYCYQWRGGGKFHTPRGMGLMCAWCIVDRLGYESIEDFRREQFGRRYNPRKG